MKIFRGLIVAAVALTMGGSAAAQSEGMRYRAIYYSNSQFNEIVGYVITWCDNSLTGNGYPTPYYEEEHYDC